jgi:stringent starvation protein B
MHEWMTDNNQTPLIVVDAEPDSVVVPREHVKDGRIVLNIAWAATRDLQLGNDEISFQARFGGVPHAVSLPLAAVKGIYARESGQGMVFQDEPGLDDSHRPQDASISADAGSQQITSDKRATGDTDPNSRPEDPKPRPRGPNLRVVK